MTTRLSKSERREQIMDAAITCFADKGYHETSMDDIVRQAQLSKGALYWHFSGKRELFSSLFQKWMTEFGNAVVEGLQQAESAKAKLRVVVDAIRRNAAANPDLMRAELEFWTIAMRDDEFRGWMKQTYDADVAFMESILREGIENGEFREVPVESTARMIMAYLDGAFLHREIRDPVRSVSETLDEVLETVEALLDA